MKQLLMMTALLLVTSCGNTTGTYNSKPATVKVEQPTDEYEPSRVILDGDVAEYSTNGDGATKFKLTCLGDGLMELTVKDAGEYTFWNRYTLLEDTILLDEGQTIIIQPKRDNVLNVINEDTGKRRRKNCDGHDARYN